MNNLKKREILFKKSAFASLDMLKFLKLVKKRKNDVNSLKNHDIQSTYYVNTLATQIHPKKLDLEIYDIIDESADTKTFCLTTINKNIKLPNFRPGQYLSVDFNIDGVIITRPYTISSSPNNALNDNFMTITIQLRPNGYVTNYIFENWVVGTKISTSGPQGNFYYSSLRDKQHIVGLASNSGITPFYSMALAIAEGSLDATLTILYCNKDPKNVIFYKQLKQLANTFNNKIKVIFYATSTKTSGFEYGHLNTTIVKNYIDQSSIYICGSYKFISSCLDITSKLNIPKKLIRHDDISEISKFVNDQQKAVLDKPKTFTITAYQYDKKHVFQAQSNETIMKALQKAKINIKSSCLSGKCSWCQVRLVSGKVLVPIKADHRRAADKTAEIYYSCSSYPMSDLVIIAN